MSTDATLLSTNGGEIYRINGTIHLGRPGRVIIPQIPDELIAKPTLVWLLRNSAAAEQRVEASYLTGGVTWKADYVFTLNAKDDLGELYHSRWLAELAPKFPPQPFRARTR